MSGEAGLRPASSRSRSALMPAPSAARSTSAAAAAAPKPAMPATFSVPARAPRSWPPPLMSGAGNGTAASRLTSAPTPLGAPILCPESVRRSAPSALISHGIRPAAWTASTCRTPPAAWVRRAACRNRLNNAGLVVGEHQRNQRPAPAAPPEASASAARSIRPSPVTGTRLDRRGGKPSAGQHGGMLDAPRPAASGAFPSGPSPASAPACWLRCRRR